MTVAEEPWYRDGLAFECTRCGNCCTGAPGFVWVDDDEIQRLAEFQGESLDDFGRKYLRQVGRDLSLIEKPGGDCIFWDRLKGCTVYEARPVQCRTWPFWPENIESLEDWTRVRRGCPGAGQGRLYTIGEIVASAERTPQ